MEFKVIKSKEKKGKTSSVSISADLLDEVISILSNVDCTCVWSPTDNQYIKVNDIPQSLIDDLVVAKKLSGGLGLSPTGDTKDVAAWFLKERRRW